MNQFYVLSIVVPYCIRDTHEDGRCKNYGLVGGRGGCNPVDFLGKLRDQSRTGLRVYIVG